MSEASGAPNGDSETFSAREQKLLVAAMGSLKSGPPEIDMDVFIKLGGFNARKTAQNQWGALKRKINLNKPDGEEGVAVKTPSKTPSKKRTKKDADGEDGADEDEGSASKKAKTPGKTTGKKNTVDGHGSPAKKGSKARGKKAAAAAAEDTGAEDTGAEDTGAEESTVKPEPVADGEEDAPYDSE
ncbi:hypothetical protein CERZMDRAFT_87778 [Cercospora zeae-maydis SCOH1-5]|uniref:Uncharacterized protein n=1 Tax=Cercospora zeae-maydis SCOH1-5 TaxID=717836 RepID=A0A6A6F7K1_9PEZI|nr:hypothetical protein CERZMDRAFT_87778 [Cercospora zeae-maydis SCOH1-5]